jgi:hypothetical protein
MPWLMVKASHLLRYSTLKQKEGESGADFVDWEKKEFIALREMGINVDDSLRLTKFIQQDTTNSKPKSLAQTVFTTPKMILSIWCNLTRRDISPIQEEMIHMQREHSASMLYSAVTHCKKKGHAVQSCTKKTKYEQKNQIKSQEAEEMPKEEVALQLPVLFASLQITLLAKPAFLRRIWFLE